LSNPRPFASPVLVLAMGVLAVSTASIFIRYAQEYAPSLVIAAWRMTLATVILAPFAITLRRSELRSLTKRELGLALLSGFFLALHFATWISSLAFTTLPARSCWSIPSIVGRSIAQLPWVSASAGNRCHVAGFRGSDHSS
jgi:drug/metabolite transporter (DMT)-like permease